MSLCLTDEERMLADTARAFLDDAAPVSHLRGLRDAGQTHDAGLWQEMVRMGWAGILVPEDAGGVDMGQAAAGLLAEEMGKTLATTPFLSTSVIAATLFRAVSDTRGPAALSAIAAGQARYALAIDEGPKFAPEACGLRAEPDGNGFRLTGQKRFVVDGAGADRLLVVAQAPDGLALFDIPADRKGVACAARPMIDARDAASVDFDRVEATGDDLLGAPGDAMTLLRPAIMAGQAALSAEMTGLATGAFQMTLGYLKERMQFGAPIGAFQALQHRAAHLWTEVELTRSTIRHAGRMLDQDPENAALAVSLAKARACRTATLAVQEGVQMHGGIGMTDAYDMGFFMKRARVAAEWLGDYSYHADVVARLRGL